MNTKYDPAYVRRCRRRAAFEKVRYTLYWVVPLALLLILTLSFIYVFSVRTAWQKFTFTLALDVSYAEGEDSMRAQYSGNDVRLCYNNTVNVYNMIIDAKATGVIFGGSGGETIHVDFGNGHTMEIININDDRCFVSYHGEKDYRFKIGVQGMFSKFKRIVSVGGANMPNSPWNADDNAQLNGENRD